MNTTKTCAQIRKALTALGITKTQVKLKTVHDGYITATIRRPGTSFDKVKGVTERFSFKGYDDSSGLFIRVFVRSNAHKQRTVQLLKRVQQVTHGKDQEFPVEGTGKLVARTYSREPQDTDYLLIRMDEQGKWAPGTDCHRNLTAELCAEELAERLNYLTDDEFEALDN